MMIEGGPPESVMQMTKRVLWYHVGQDHRISRPDLVDRVNGGLAIEAEDRLIRKCIEQLRQEDPDGGLIMSSSRLDGYWIANKPEEIEQAIAEDLSRIETARKKIENRRKAINRMMALQPALPGVG